MPVEAQHEVHKSRLGRSELQTFKLESKPMKANMYSIVHTATLSEGTAQ